MRLAVSVAIWMILIALKWKENTYCVNVAGKKKDTRLVLWVLWTK